MDQTVFNYITWAETEIENGDYIQAESCYKNALKECKTNEDFAECYISRAGLYIKKNNREQVIADLRKAADYGSADSLEMLKKIGINYTPQKPAPSTASTTQPPKQASAGFTGRQKKVYTDGEYDGEWLNGLFHGKGKHSFSDGETYEGDYVNGKRQGKGN